MAIRRISDLPNLYTTYPEASLSDCLLEVSYTPGNHIYQSFYENAQALLSAIPLPIATKTKPGIIMPGDYINIDDNGKISLVSADINNIGVLITNKPDKNWKYVATDSNGNFMRADAPTNVFLSVQPTEYLVLNYAYPVGSIYMTCSSVKFTPPGCTASVDFNDLHTGLSVAGIVSVEYEYLNPDDPIDVKPGNYPGIQMNWELLPNNCSPWSTFSNVEYGSLLSAQLPMIDLSVQISGQTEISGLHSHSIRPSQIFNARNNGVTTQSGAPGPGQLQNVTIQSGGSHAHNINFTSKLIENASSIYHTDSLARPTSYGVLMWKRINDTNVTISISAND